MRGALRPTRDDNRGGVVCYSPGTVTPRHVSASPTIGTSLCTACDTNATRLPQLGHLNVATTRHHESAALRVGDSPLPTDPRPGARKDPN